MSAETRAFVKGVKVSERHGAAEWTAERASSLILVPLALWGLWSGFVLSGGGYDGALAWFRSPVNAVLLAVTLLVSVWHMQMGLKVIVDDYIHKPGSRAALLGLIGLLCILIAAAGVFFIVRLALGSAPLPAGFGI
ncbi:MAG: succinate dehydrogenase, hydrophobic membrane anchor protein [Brevundimonas sp.]|uniref:succinate dehydrogenase, hydrophobic membrane anchor protein n=1 Tax=Brevundimonas sp. TaxID=1871086 RepID=UPI002725619C|nr:succinate dehydrogenase, hydrophobic membrane anchor protein [Brevundimonas sp.]MDO9589365.1 succinate dehydrogenase, hydrophobic membrane anchor protein [Brevundimonas sp.]MDP3368919.1 succinate dehydrogenase, hydrophobic membrane anchor protein [Brevundimonas sp.]MDP3657511.1 succinate dehydrogenase, hydrophobic membrane anchor protein [Brevundimonas sp.]MDZ4111430.1 succinate dehydrogenase, hydrophobic membrane anchor protein [Brevundimonas sp.]